MKEEGVFMGGSKCKFPAEFFLGATVNPFADPEELQLIRLRKKIKAGAQFVQTQAIYDVAKFEEWMEKVRSLGLHKQAYIIAGIVVNKSLKSIEMTHLVPGMLVPDALVERMRAAGQGNYDSEGVSIALDLIAQLRKVEGVSGIHIMAIGWESIVQTLVEKSGFLPRPVIE
jgi:methylenetetrahydrofolate reductase (NADPH)